MSYLLETCHERCYACIDRYGTERRSIRNDGERIGQLL